LCSSLLVQGFTETLVVLGDIAEAVTATSTLAAVLVVTTAAPAVITAVALGVTVVVALEGIPVAALVVMAVQVAVTNGSGKY
jgi:hypothetical protein